MSRRFPSPFPLSRSLSRPPPFQTPARPLRFASTSPSFPRRFLSTSLFLGAGVIFVAYYYDTRSIVHERVAMPFLRLVADPEQGHRLAIRLLGLSKWARPRDMGVDGDELQAELFGMKLDNPIGIAAGFDKDSEAIDGLFDLGFGYVEVGSVTPEPQPGNPKPRFFRLGEDSAAINRYGFNSLGHGHTLGRLRARLVLFSQSNPSLFPSPLPHNPIPPSSLPRSLRPGHILAVNLGKNKSSPADSNEDYVRGVRVLGPYADVVVINVSSPNTPGLRALQGRKVLEKLLKEVVAERDRIAGDSGLPKIAVKVACDLSEDELGDVASAVRQSGVEGVIVSNTTVRREGLGLRSSNQGQTGGLSGRPLFPHALHALKTLRPLLPPSIPVIGCGGITTGADALEMAHAGASLVQLYTVFGYRGVGTPRLLKNELASSLGGSSWQAQIGRDWKGEQMGWDEARFKKDNEAVRREEEGLGELLRQFDEDEGTRRLIEEAEMALGYSKAQRGRTEPRDNALGSQGGSKDGITKGLVEAAPRHPAMEETSSQRAPSRPSLGAPSIEEALESEPVEVDLMPMTVMVADESSVRGVDEEEEWRRAARGGSRRLV